MTAIKQMKPTNAVGFATVLTTALSKRTGTATKLGCGSVHPQSSLKRVKLHFISDYACVKPNFYLFPQEEERSKDQI